MSRQLLTAACAVDAVLTLLFTQGGMFLIGKTHADAKHGTVPHEVGFGMSAGNVAALALLLAVCLLFHGLWCWRKSRAPAGRINVNSAEKILIVAAPLVAAVIAIVIATSLANHGAV